MALRISMKWRLMPHRTVTAAVAEGAEVIVKGKEARRASSIKKPGNRYIETSDAMETARIELVVMAGMATVAAAVILCMKADGRPFLKPRPTRSNAQQHEKHIGNEYLSYASIASRAAAFSRKSLPAARSVGGGLVLQRGVIRKIALSRLYPLKFRAGSEEGEACAQMHTEAER